MNFTSISKIRTRLINLIDLVLVGFSQFESINQYGLDQAKLQQWCYLLKEIIIQKQDVIQSLNQNKKELYSEKVILPVISFKKQAKFQCDKLIDIIDGSKLHVYGKKQQHKAQFNFNQGSLKRFSSIVQVSQHKFIIAGGCLFSNPTLKTANISLFEANIGQIKKIGQMIEPVSSHCSIFINPRVYFIGGKKKQGVITKMCSYYDIYRKQVNEIADLNYAAASMCVIQWKDQYIYKIGGLGQSFGQWSISPYIERYDIEQDIWQVINPYIPQSSMHNFSNFQLYAHSFGYVTQNDQIVIFGGFDLSKKPTKFGSIISIKGKNQNEQTQQEGFQSDIHEIVRFGTIEGIQAGGFWNSQFIFQQNNNKTQYIYAVQTIMSPKLETKLVKIQLN